MNYKELLNSITDGCKSILTDNLAGIYVHGSIAMNCFNLNKSDIDFIIVVNEELSVDCKRKLMEIIAGLNEYAPAKGLEMSMVLKENCTHFKYPTPYELHFSNAHLDWYQKDAKHYCENMHGEDKDLAAHFTIIKNYGIVWYGLPVDEVFGPVPREAYLDSILEDIEWAGDRILENPMYLVLNMCRVLAFLKDGLVLSKLQGGDWGLKSIGDQYHKIISEARLCYISDKTMMIDREEAEDFYQYMMNEIKHGSFDEQ